MQTAENAAEARLASCQADFEAAAQQLQARVGAAEVEKARLQTQVRAEQALCRRWALCAHRWHRTSAAVPERHIYREAAGPRTL